MKRFSRAIILVLGTMLVCFSGLDAKDRSAKGVKLNYKIVGRRAGDIEKVWADPKKANEVLGWKAETSLEDTLASAWKWQVKLREEGIQ